MAEMAKLQRTRNILLKKLFFQTHFKLDKNLVKKRSAPTNTQKMHANLFKLAKVKKIKKENEFEKDEGKKIKEKTNVMEQEYPGLVNG